MSKRIWTFSLILIVISLLLSGCYYFSAKKEIANAEKLISELKKEGGTTIVPYEYCGAEKFLEISKMEFDEGDYKDAKGFAERSKSVAETGLVETKKKK